jgi:hypothetical protein
MPEEKNLPEFMRSRQAVDWNQFPSPQPPGRLGGTLVTVLADPGGGSTYRVGLRTRPETPPAFLGLITHTSMTEAEAQAEDVRNLVEDIAYRLGRERINELRHGEQLVALRGLVLRIAENLGMSRSLVDHDLACMFPSMLEQSQGLDRLAMVFVPGLRRILVATILPEEEGRHFSFDAADLDEMLCSPHTMAAGYILIEVTSVRWVRFRILDVVVPPLVPDMQAKQRTLELLGLEAASSSA